MGIGQKNLRKTNGQPVFIHDDLYHPHAEISHHQFQGFARRPIEGNCATALQSGDLLHLHDAPANPHFDWNCQITEYVKFTQPIVGSHFSPPWLLHFYCQSQKGETAGLRSPIALAEAQCLDVSNH